MQKEFLLLSDGLREKKIEAKVFEEVKPLKALNSETGWKIFQFISKKPSYPAEIAKKLNLHEQKVYYYIKQLKASGLIELSKTEERLGGTAKYFSPAFECIALIPSKQALKEKKEFSVSKHKELQEVEPKIKEFFESFISKGKLNAKIVVGSPDPHGEFKARARDAHLAIEFSAFIGGLCEEITFPFALLDTDIKSLEAENSNLIIIGGILTNRIAKEVNKKLKCKFMPFGGHWVLESSISKKQYNEDAIGLIEIVEHPFYKNKKIMVVAGIRNAGTKAAIIALIKHTKETANPNLFDNASSCKIVEGLDLDGDGIIDEAEIRE